MNSQTKLTTANLRRMLLITALAVCPFIASQTGLAQNATGILSQTGTGSTAFTVNITTTTTFQLSLNITASFQSVGITYFYQTGANGSSLFSLVARNTTGSPYSDLTTSDAVAFTPVAGLLDPVNDKDLGATSADVTVGSPPGSYFISSITFAINASITPGTYTFFMDPRAIVADNNFADHTLTGNTVTVTIVPEPATVGLAVMGGVMLLAFALRARRVTA